MTYKDRNYEGYLFCGKATPHGAHDWKLLNGNVWVECEGINPTDEELNGHA